MSDKFTEPLTPEWPMNVMVFKPTDKVEEIKAKIEPTQDPIIEISPPYGGAERTHTSDNHFNTKHYALLFEPGEYKDCNFEVGYYVQMAGLGKDAEGGNAVRFTGRESGPYVHALNKDLKYDADKGGSIAQAGWGLCLDTFWRSAENFSAENIKWAVSQAAPIRRVYVKENLIFGDGPAWSSGGFVANAKVDGVCNYVANQQWCSRACSFGKAENGAWSTVFIGCTGNLPEGDVKKPDRDHVATIEETPEVRMEKPFIALNTVGNYDLHVPKATREHTSGPQLDSSNNEIRPFSQVKVGKPILPMKDGEYVNHDDHTFNILCPEDKKITNELQEALDEGKDLVLCPGIFFLTKPLIIKYTNQVILGLGLATLVAPQDGSPCIRVQPNTHGVRVAGLMLEASKQIESPNSTFRNSDNVSSLISFGEPEVTDDAGDRENPGLLSDIFTRVGGSNLDRSVSTDIMVRVHSGNVIGDNLWLWRADHVRLAPDEAPNDLKYEKYHQVRIWEEEDGKKVKVNECVAKNAIEVTGDDVKMYGLFCEHTTEHQCVWKGERGSTTFFQCELPYDVDIDYANDNFTGYFVDQTVEKHTARGLGVYSNFTCYNVNARTGIQLPSKEGIVLQNPFTRFLNNKGSIKNVIQQGGALYGEAVNKENKQSNAWIGDDRAVSLRVSETNL